MANTVSSMAAGFRLQVRQWLIFASLLGLAGCSTIGLNAPWESSPSDDYDLISRNFVDVFAQLPQLNPESTAVKAGKAQTRFDQSVLDELALRGYTIGALDSNDGVNVVRSQVQRKQGTGGQTYNHYVMAIGKVSAERSFDTVAGETAPVSELTIRGAGEPAVTLNDNIFATVVESYSQIAYEKYNGPQIQDVLQPRSRPKGFGFWFSPRQNAVKRNIYETMTSNYRDVFTQYEDIEQDILVFPNDSLVLSDVNENVIEQYVEIMNPDTDVVSVIGCSHGETAINNGNSLLALGRANRVKETLLFLGVRHDQILDEGCWAPQTFDEVMPQRGVVLTLKRSVDS
ncbi:MAG: hypothetical protein KTR32_23120 [Granulosicoccus sp.]|nr:hypothetical protein [Granulosicoccus sp.]